MMRKELRSHWTYYLFLLVLFFSTMILSSLFVTNPQMQMLIVVAVTVLYIVLSLFHHKVEHDLHLKIILEYVIMGGLGISLIFLLIRFLM